MNHRMLPRHHVYALLLGLAVHEPILAKQKETIRNQKSRARAVTPRLWKLGSH